MPPAWYAAIERSIKLWLPLLPLLLYVLFFIVWPLFDSDSAMTLEEERAAYMAEHPLGSTGE